MLRGTRFTRFMFASALTAALIAGVSLTASAAEITCSNSTVTANGNPGVCEAYAGNDQLNSPLTVNSVQNATNPLATGAHQFTDWQFASKVDFNPDEPNDKEFTVAINLGFDVTFLTFNDDDEPLSGTWSVTPNALDGYEDFMIVLKGGNGFAAWLFNDTDVDGGTWSIDRRPAFSHMSLYVRGESTTQVPEPMTLALVGAGLLGLGFARRRRS